MLHKVINQVLLFVTFTERQRCETRSFQGVLYQPVSRATCLATTQRNCETSCEKLPSVQQIAKGNEFLPTCFLFSPLLAIHTNIFEIYVRRGESKTRNLSSTTNNEVIMLVARHSCGSCSSLLVKFEHSSKSARNDSIKIAKLFPIPWQRESVDIERHGLRGT